MYVFIPSTVPFFHIHSSAVHQHMRLSEETINSITIHMYSYIPIHSKSHLPNIVLYAFDSLFIAYHSVYCGASMEYSPIEIKKSEIVL